MAEAERTERISREARWSGLRSARRLSQGTIRRRRLEVWMLAAALVVVAVGAVLLLPSLPSNQALRTTKAVARIALVVLATGFIVYALEKEIHLRRLSTILANERALNTALTEKLREHSLLADVGRAVNSAGGMAERLRVVLASAVELTGARGASIWLPTEDGRFRCAAELGGEQTVGAVAEETAFLARLRSSRRVELVQGTEVTRGPFAGPSDGGRLYAPLVDGEDAVGVLCLVASPDRPFGEYLVAPLDGFARTVGAAIGEAQTVQVQQARADELLEMYRLKTELVQTVSRRLHDPLAGILGSVITLRGLGLSGPDRDAVLDVIERDTRRALAVVERLSEASASREGDDAPTPQAIDAGEIVTRLAEELRRGGRDVRVESAAELLVRGDVDALRRVLATLAQWLADRGASSVSFAAIRSGGRAVVDVTGVAASRSDPGSGREELPIVRAVIAALGGRVAGPVEEGAGTTFRIELPLVVTQAVR